MPVGNGDIGLNAWVEEGGDLVFYIGKTDSWDDNGRLLKVGRVRLILDPAPVMAPFEQTLHLADATMTVHCGPTLRLWVDANHAVIELTVDSPEPVTATAIIEPWRTEPETLPELESSDIFVEWNKPDGMREPTVVEPDTMLTEQRDRIGWFHRNIKSVGPALTAEQQGLSEFERPDPLLHRTFGAVIQTDGDVSRLDDLRLQSSAALHHTFRITVLTLHPATADEWLAAVDEAIAAVERLPSAERRTSHQRWWENFWSRSWIHVTAADESSDDAAVVSQSYALQRYVQACAGRGAYPIKFNGSIFNLPYPGKHGDADYRRWGPGYWWQNTRLPYFSMCAAGDFEMMQPLFQLYARDLFDLWRYRTQKYYGHDGIFLSECIYFWGDVFPQIYGWTPPFAERDDPIQESPWHKWEWVGGLELTWLMLDFFAYTGDTRFLQETLLPFAEQTLLFIDHFYDSDDTGTLVIHPAQALETWWECTNPMDLVSGLRAVTARLLALPVTDHQRATWEAFAQKLPALPIHTVDGTRMLAPAAAFDDFNNVENPELYAVFPFRLITVGKPDADLGIAALEHRTHRGHFGWRQDDLFMAYLGLADQTRSAIVSRARNQNHDCVDEDTDPSLIARNNSRFPAFWGPNYDWFPDQCHGGVLATTLQSMILQCDGDRITLLPAWPHDWDVDFKLCAPGNTTVTGRVRNGELVDWSITPAARRADVHVP